MDRTRMAALMLLCLALAGCTDASDDGGLPTGFEDDTTEEEGIQKPQWHAGLWWTWEYTFRQGSLLPPIVELVVSEATGTEFLVEPTDDIWAFSEANSDVAPVGPHRASDLAMPMPGGGYAQILQWPLTDGAEWTFQWYGSTFSAVGTMESDTRYKVVATHEDGSIWTYWYDDALAWLESFNVVDAEGNGIVEMQATRGDGNYTGEVVRATVTELVSVAGTGPHQETEADWDFSDSTDADVYASLFLSCSQGSAFIGVGTVESITQPSSEATGIDDGYSYLSPCPFDDSYFGRVGDDPDQGTWGYAVDVASEDAAWGLTAWLAEYERITV